MAAYRRSSLLCHRPRYLIRSVGPDLLKLTRGLDPHALQAIVYLAFVLLHVRVQKPVVNLAGALQETGNVNVSVREGNSGWVQQRAMNMAGGLQDKSNALDSDRGRRLHSCYRRCHSRHRRFHFVC